MKIKNNIWFISYRMKIKNIIWFINYSNNEWKLKILFDLFYKEIMNEN